MAKINKTAQKTEKQPPRIFGEDTRFQPGNPGGPGRPRGHKNWDTIIKEVGTHQLPDKFLKKLNRRGWNLPPDTNHQEALVVAQYFSGINENSKSATWLSSNSGANLSELLQLMSNIDLNKLSTEQLQRIQNGENPLQVILSAYLLTPGTESKG